MIKLVRSLYFKLIIAFTIVIAIGIGLASILISRFTTNEFGFYLGSPALVPESSISGTPSLREKQINEGQAPLPGSIRRRIPVKTGDERLYLPGRFALTPEEWSSLRDSLPSGQEEVKKVVESLNLSQEDKETLMGYINRRMIRNVYPSNPRPAFPNTNRRVIMERLGAAENAFLGEVRNFLWISGAIAFSVAILISLFFTRQILYPVRRLSMASNRIAAGDFKSRVEIKSKDEVGKLGQAFNIMAGNLQIEKEREKALLADVSHELRTPLSILGGKLEAMLDEVIQPTPQELASMHDEVLLLSRLVQDLQTLSLAEAGRLEMHFAKTDISSLSGKVVSSFKNMADTKNVSLKLEIDEGIPPMSIDQDRISQVLRNLISNALRYSPDRGVVEINIYHGEAYHSSDKDTFLRKSLPGMIVFSVADSGTGIPKEEISHVFERFYRVDRSRSRTTGGSGLGLAIAKQLVEAHLGTIWVVSELGKGTKVLFSLPVRL